MSRSIRISLVPDGRLGLPIKAAGILILNSVRIPDALDGRLREHGVEGLWGFGNVSRRHTGAGAESAVRIAGLCLRRLAADGPDLRRTGQQAARKCTAREGGSIVPATEVSSSTQTRTVSASKLPPAQL